MSISKIPQVTEIFIVVSRSSTMEVFVPTVNIYKFISNVNFIFSAKLYNFVSVFTSKRSTCIS